MRKLAEPNVNRPKRCSRCGNVKPADAFRVVPRKRATAIALYGKCRECERESTREQSIKNRERVRDSQRAYRERSGESLREEERATYWENPDKFRAKTSAWRRSNPDKRRAQTKVAHARRRGARAVARELLLTEAQWLELIEEFGGCCAYCGSSSRALTRDHVIPVSKGGTHTKDNIVPACRSCNSSKGAQSKPHPRPLTAQGT